MVHLAAAHLRTSDRRWYASPLVAYAEVSEGILVRAPILRALLVLCSLVVLVALPEVGEHQDLWGGRDERRGTRGNLAG
jgi:hypothetical protein